MSRDHLKLLLRVLALAVGLAVLPGSRPAAAGDSDSCPLGWHAIHPPEQRSKLAFSARDSRLVHSFTTRAAFHSSDCGRTWQGPTLVSWPFQHWWDIYIDETDVFYTNVSNVGPGALFASTDYGATWSRRGPERFERLNDLTGSLGRPGTLYAIWSRPEKIGYREKLERTDDGGLTWEQVSLIGFLPAVDPAQPGTAYGLSAFEGRQPAPLYLVVSKDEGATWQPQAPLPFSTDAAPLSMAVGPDSAIWVAAQPDLMYVSTDGGASFMKLPVPFRRPDSEVRLQRLVLPPYTVVVEATPKGWLGTPETEVWTFRPPTLQPSSGFFRQANGRGGEGEGGFLVADETDIPMWSAFQGVPLQAIGYPVSRRFPYKGLPTQAMQKLVLQWQPGRGVVFLNVLDELHDAGKDPWLQVHRSIPPPEDTRPDAGLPWEQVVARHLAILDRDPALKAAWLAEPAWLDLYGLPMGYGDYPSVSVVRGQRAALQRWKSDTPWARAGEVTIANGGDIAKEAGLFPAEALVPQPPP